MPDNEDRDKLMPDWERFYLYRVEMYLIHKYQPELVDTLKFTFRRARLRREGLVKHDENILHSPEEFAAQLQADLYTYVPWKPKKPFHKKESLERPGIGADYQDRFNNL